MEAVPVLVNALKDAGEEFSAAIITALGRIGGAEALPVLLSVARDKERPVMVRRRAVLALGGFEDDQAASVCRALLKDNSVSAEAALALHMLGDDSGVAVLDRLLYSDEPDDSLRAVRVLTRIQSSQATSLLFSAAKIKDVEVALVAALELVARSKFEGLAILQVLLATEDAKGKLEDVLGEFELARVLYPAMEWLGETKDRDLKMAILEVLGRLGIADLEVPADSSLADYEKLARRWQRWWEATVARLPSGPGRIRDEEGETEEEREGVMRGLDWLRKRK
jgi:HEAT repeat protein